MTSDHAQLCDLLKRLEPGFMPRNVFQAVARLVVLPTFVVVPLLRRGGRVLVLLQERDVDDPHYASMLHPAGTVIRADDESLSSIYLRLMSAELPHLEVREGPVFVNVSYDLIARGREISLVHWIEIRGGAAPSCLFDTDNLPRTVVQTDYARIASAADHFRAHRG